MQTPRPPASRRRRDTGAKSDDFGAAFGDTVAKAPVVWTKPPPPTAPTLRLHRQGRQRRVLLPKAGTYTATMPKTFNLHGTNGGGATVVTATCTTTAAGPDRHHHAEQAERDDQGQGDPASVKKGAVVTVKGKIKNEYVKAGGPAVTGKVIIKDGKKKVGTAKIKKGKFTVKLKGLTVGSHKLTVSYKGDDYTDKGSARSSRSPSSLPAARSHCQPRAVDPPGPAARASGVSASTRGPPAPG